MLAQVSGVCNTLLGSLGATCVFCLIALNTKICRLQVFGVFNTLLGSVVPNSRIEFDDDWEEKSDIAATGSRLLRYTTSVVTALYQPWSQPPR